MNRSSGRRLRWLALPATLLLALCCQGASDRMPDGETHFLRACLPGSDDCGPDLTCVCGACLPPCTGGADCEQLGASAACVTAAERLGGVECTAPPAGDFCDIPCATDANCGSLTAGHHCVDGFCRPCPHGEVSASEVVILGDVFIAQDREVVRQLEALAHDAGALGPDDHYRDYSSVTQNALLLGDALLRDRYAEALAEAPVRVVVMNGGGSDMLLGVCPGAPGPDCPLVADTATAAEQLLAQMALDGVEQVLWFYYPDPENPDLLAKLDALQPLLQNVCATSPVPCQWLDLRPAFAGSFSQYMVSDFVPSPLGAQVAATTIWASMQQGCIAQ